ncbi:hypothetical protein H8E65_02265 [Candidatus Bathyarchaeota archaeon]|nr:hypothetical protein [Candidatus Bathyarchaeota archaeon]MBL7079477.1 hypothetical protein [Candidatus Bathyarchaeota archaeon]
MEPEHIIDETAIIPGADIEKVYDDCVEWVRSIKAVIREENKPFLIKAFHYYEDPLVSTPDSGWDWHPKNFAKTIVIILDNAEEAVHFRFIIERPIGFFTSAAIEKYRRWWILYLVALLNHLKLDDDLSKSKQYISRSNLEKMSSDIKREFRFPILFSIIMGIVGIYLLMNRDSIGVIFVIGGLFVPIRVVYEDQRLKKRIREIYPER